jgi:dienelactone hydrolase
MQEPVTPAEASEDAGKVRGRRRWRRGGPTATVAAVLATVAGLIAALLTLPSSASAADDGNSYQRGPDPTVSSVAASRGPFATSQTSVGGGHGFKDATIYYPTDTSQGTWGAVAIVPGYTAQFADEEAWMGPWLSSFGFVVIGIDTNSPNDWDTDRGTQLLAALDYLTTQSSVRDRVDPNRLAVIGHSMGGGGVVYATEHRPSLKAAIGLAPFSPSQSMATDKVPTMVMGGQKDPTVTPSYLNGLLATLPSSTQSAFVQIAGADHLYYTRPNANEMRIAIPWLKIFVDGDTRYGQFLCPSLADPSGISQYTSKCPYVPPGSTTTGGTTTGGTTGGGTTGGTGGTGSPVHAVGAGKCLDVPGSSQANETQVQIYDCSGAANQAWKYDTSSRSLSVYGGAKCLDAHAKGTTAGTEVQIYDCNGGTNQQWNINSNGTITGVQSGLCLDVTNKSTANGAPVELWTCNGGSNQQWKLG